MKKVFSIVFVLTLMTIQLVAGSGMSIENCCKDKAELITGIDHGCCDDGLDKNPCSTNDDHHCNCIYNITFINPQIEIDFTTFTFNNNPVSYITVGTPNSFLEEFFQPPRL